MAPNDDRLRAVARLGASTMTAPDPAAIAASLGEKARHLQAFGWARSTEAAARVLRTDNLSAYRLGVAFGEAGLIEWRGQYLLTPLGRAVASLLRENAT